MEGSATFRVAPYRDHMQIIQPSELGKRPDGQLLSPRSVGLRFKSVVIVNPPSPPGYVANRDSMGGYGQLYPIGATLLPPLDVPYLVAFLEEKKVPHEVIEAQGLELNVEKLAQQIARIAGANESERTLVVVRTALPSLDWDLSVCAAMKAAAPNASMAIYGSIVGHVLHRIYKEPCLDYVLVGEADETVLELFGGRPEEEILGLKYRRSEVWQETQPRPFLKELDKLPFPKWERLPYQRYRLPKSSATAARSFLPMLTSRGCPFGCHYCPYPVGQGLPWRYRSPQNVVNEIEHLVKDLGIEYILFRDPMFSMRQDRVVEICKEIQRRGLVFKWKCETRPDCLTEETVAAMAAAGCDGINFGVESSEEDIQKNVGRKPISREKIVKMTAVCRRHGIKTFCFFILGLPGDTVQTVLETIGFAVRLRANWVQFTAASPLIGTKLRDWAVSQGLTTHDEYSYNSSHEAMIGNENLTKSQVAGLLRFAQLFERYIINRGGILKDDNRKGFLYTAAKTLADFSSDLFGRTLYAIGRNRFERAYAQTS
jgi:anaerobic magnesium-protoporphyrin IX monomethyl ester cyclase